MVQRIAVISDLHCHPSTLSRQDTFLYSDIPARPVTKNPISSLQELINTENLNVNLLLVLGDITNMIDRQGFISGWNHVNNIANMLHAEDVIAAIGNHDVDSRKIHGSNPFDFCRNLNLNYPFRGEDAIARFWANGFEIYDTQSISVCCINSTFAHTDEKQAERGSISQTQIEQLKTALNQVSHPRIKIAIAHHHPIQHEEMDLGSDDLMSNGSVLIDTLSDNGFMLFLHGHKHFPRIKYAAGDITTPVVFAAGSFSAISPSMLTNSRNLFHIIEIDDEQPLFNLPIKGKIFSWEWGLNRGWRRTSMNSGGIPYQCGFGCRIELSNVALRIVNYLRGVPNHFVEDWSAVQNAIPEIQYLLPNDLSELCDLLERDHNVKIAPRLPDSPAIIGILGEIHETK